MKQHNCGLFEDNNEMWEFSHFINVFNLWETTTSSCMHWCYSVPSCNTHTEAVSVVHQRFAGSRYTLVAHWANYHHITQYQPRGVGPKRSLDSSTPATGTKRRWGTKDSRLGPMARGWSSAKGRRSQVRARSLVLFPLSPFFWAVFPESLQSTSYTCLHRTFYKHTLVLIPHTSLHHCSPSIM